MNPTLRKHAKVAARGAVRRLPLPAQNAVHRVWRRIRPVAPPAAREIVLVREITLAADVADAEALRSLLSDTDIFAGADEADAYLTDALERFRVTMSLLPPLRDGARVLELGANPYFLTRLLRYRGLEVTCANWFGEQSGMAAEDSQVVTCPSTGLSEEFRFDHFNVETSRFPYADGSFDLVLCCEILEHLPNDPIHLLAEVHRVLAKPGGQLLLTTPNATRADNLVRMIDGLNVYEELSGFGTYGRHNREYTVSELRTLLSECGYIDTDVFAHDVHLVPANWEGKIAEACLQDRGDNLFALARATGEPRWRYPRWLYSSRHAIRRVVRPDLIMGINDDVQAWGLHLLEEMPEGLGRWTGTEHVTALLSADVAGKHTLRIEGQAPPPDAGAPLVVRVEIAGETPSWEVACDGLPFNLTADVTVSKGDHQASLWTDRTWVPEAVGLGNDNRQLGIVLRRMALDPG
jgi:SAM-dependent methyltransferase